MIRTPDYEARYPGWNDWKWQCANRITTADETARYLGMSEEGKKQVEACLGLFRMAITPYYASLIDPSDPDDPIAKIAVPSIEETLPCKSDMADPLCEERDSPCRISCTAIPTACCFW